MSTAPYDVIRRALDNAEARWPDGQITDEIYELAYARDELAKLVAETVTEARAAGVTWKDIGDALDITPQGAQQRYGKDA